MYRRGARDIGTCYSGLTAFMWQLAAYAGGGREPGAQPQTPVKGLLPLASPLFYPSPEIGHTTTGRYIGTGGR